MMQRRIMKSVWVVAFYVAAVVCGVSQAFIVAPPWPSFGVAIPLVGRSMSSNNEDGISPMIESEPEQPPKPAVKCPDCDLCDGSGRIIGGIGVVLPWWPIKAFRPCPNFINAGGIYTRAGQGLDEIAFGADSTWTGQD